MIYTYWTAVSFVIFINAFLYILWGKGKLADGGQVFCVILSASLFFLLTAIPGSIESYTTTNLLQVREVYKADDEVLLVDNRHNTFRLPRSWKNDTIEKGDVYYLLRSYNYFHYNNENKLYWYNDKKNLNKKYNKLKN
jgi:hypothetical protein